MMPSVQHAENLKWYRYSTKTKMHNSWCSKEWHNIAMIRCGHSYQWHLHPTTIV